MKRFIIEEEQHAELSTQESLIYGMYCDLIKTLLLEGYKVGRRMDNTIYEITLDNNNTIKW